MMAAFQDLRQTKEWARYLEMIGWKVEKIKNEELRIENYLYIRKIPLLPFSIAKLQRPKGEIDWKEIKRLRKKHRIVHLVTKDTVANKTIWIDLTKTERQLLREMKQKTRYNIGLAKRKNINVQIIKGTQIQQNQREDFYQLLRQNARRLGIFAMPRSWYEAQIKAFGEKCFAVLAYLSASSGQVSELIAGNFFMTSSTACFYSHNGSTEVGRRLMAPSLCAWEGIKEAKRRKLKIFDFDGIDDGSKEYKRWKGFTRFKEGFGGEEETFPISF